MLPRVRVAALLAPLAIVAALVAVPTPAQAAGGGTHAGDVVLYDSCQTYPVTYSASFPSADSTSPVTAINVKVGDQVTA